MRENKLVHWEIKERIQHFADYAEGFFYVENNEYKWNKDYPDEVKDFIMEILIVSSEMIEEINQAERDKRMKDVAESVIARNYEGLKRLSEDDNI